jgi:WXG100 family type VII secretion target
MSNGGIVQYDYAGIAAVTGQLQSCKTEAEMLLHTGTSFKTQMEGSWHGTASNSFSDAYQRFNNVQQNTIDTCQATINAINQGVGDFQGGEMQAAGGY